jgi:hypothetical protein
MYAKCVLTSLTVLGVAVLAAAPYAAWAQTGTAWLYAYQGSPGPSIPAVMGVAAQLGTPGAAIFGHLPSAGVVGEVAIAQAVLSIGDQVPLPTYADGTPATESDVFWTSQLWRAEFFADGIVRYQSGDRVVATFNGRQLANVEGQINTGGPVPPTPSNVQVLVTAVAVRSATTPTTRATIGSIKARYR